MLQNYMYTPQSHELLEGAAKRSRLHVWLVMWRSRVRTPSKATVVSLSNMVTLYLLAVVLTWFVWHNSIYVIEN